MVLLQITACAPNAAVHRSKIKVTASEAQRSPDGGIVQSDQPMIILVFGIPQIACLGL
ncbi:hypothetical protein [Tardiphaga sp. 619_E2_N8_6]|uniref:hypothetical protein n=1 Tax=Tardiphaga sp. 619_E2_N8_6 TaxID=3240782 RepID=UPI003F2400A0